MMPLAVFVAKSLGKRINKAISQSAIIEGNILSYFTEMIKGSKLIKIYQQENFELDKSQKKLNVRMNIQNKIGFICQWEIIL